MTITAGTRLGPYEIVAPIGAGGMGEVYKARDTRLDRAVAIKILPAEFASDAQLKVRFEREAKTISQLSHPNICTLFDVGDNYLVMELLDGETLADRLSRGPLPIGEAIQIGIQIADALDKAHRAGIIHRDLKPGNVMLTSGGVKLLDFGLAKTNAVTGPASVTMQKPVTQEGTIVGTLQYMAPEQLEGREMDGRADIFALGAMLYEMVSGRRAFDGESRASIIARILSSEPPPLATLQRVTPPALDRIVKRCLAKHPTLRWQCAGDVRRELELVGEEEVSERRPVLPSRSLAVLVILLGLIAAAEGIWLMRQRKLPSASDRIVRFTVESPPNTYIKLANDIGPPAITRDGRAVAFVAVDVGSGRRALWVRDLQSVQAKRIEGTEGASFPFWSPDGNSIGFFASGKLKRVDLAGSTPQTLAAASFGRGGAWGEDGKILFVPTPSTGLYRVSARGGAVDAVTQLDRRAGEVSQRWPQILPDGRHVLLLVRRPGIGVADALGDAMYVFDLGTGGRKFLARVSSNAMYVERGLLLFARDRTLMAQPFDLKTLQLGGEPTPIVQNVQFHPSGFAMFAVSASGVLCYQTGTLISELRVVDRRGALTGTFLEPAEYFVPTLDVAHRQFAVSITDPATGYDDIWQYDMVRQVARRLTFNPADDFAPVLSPDGKRVAFASNRSGSPQLFLKNVDGAEEERAIAPAQLARFPLSWSPDGRFIAYKEIAPTTQMDIDIFDMKERTERHFLASEFNETDASFSPSGRWMAYVSDESGRPEVYVTTFPAPSARWQISSGGGTQPRWRGDEKELFYYSADGNIMAVPVVTQPNFNAGIPQRLFACELRSPRIDTGEYDVWPDGQRFLINTTAGRPRSLPLTIAIGWHPTP